MNLPASAGNAPKRQEISAADIATDRFLRLVKYLVVPRPIAWISTISAGGTENLAPYSYFSLASEKPPVALFSAIGSQNSAENAVATGEFVINLAWEPAFESVNATATRYPGDVSEFDELGIERSPSHSVSPPRVASSPASLECRLLDTVTVKGGTIVLGDIVHISIREEVLDGDRPDIKLLQPLSRLGGIQWGLLGEIREIAHIPYRPSPPKAGP